MKITTILGSPRKSGNTAAVLRRFEDLAAAAGHGVGRVNITDQDVAGCLGCDVCQTVLDRPGCVQDDDGVSVLQRILSSDLVVYAAPVYAWSFPAQMKALLDRHYCLVKYRNGRVARALFQGRRAALLVTCGGPAESNADLVGQIFDREIRYLRGMNAGIFVAPDCPASGITGRAAEATAMRMFGRLLASGRRSGRTRRTKRRPRPAHQPKEE